MSKTGQIIISRRDERKKRLIILIYILLGIVVILLGRQVYFYYQAKELNVLLISIDTLRSDHMGTYGYPKNTTPNIDEFATNAVVFSNASTIVPMTHPSFAALFTGRSSFETGIVTNGDPGLSPNNKSLASRLFEHGYKTSAFTTAEGVLTQGFEDFDYRFFKYYYHEDSKSEKYRQVKDLTNNKLVTSANEWIAKNKNDKFFTWIHLTDPHAPYFPSEELRCKFNTKYCSKIKGKSLEELEDLRFEFQSCQKQAISQDRVEMMAALYDGGIAEADKLVGEILRLLKRNGLDKKTIVIIYGDHGEGFDHNYYFNHQEVLYDSAVKVPLIIKDPRVTKNGKVDRVIQNIDILPTLLDLLRIPQAKPVLSGVSFAHEFYPLAVPTFNFRKYIYYVNSMKSKFAIFDGRYKYIYSLPESCLYKNQTDELYDLKNDPSEEKNIIGKKPEILKDLKKELNNYLGRYNLPLLPKKNGVGNKTQEDESRQDILNELKNLQY